MKNTIRKKLWIAGVFVVVMVFASMVHSHCQLPCGIYGDKDRFEMIGEHIITIEKSMKQITTLSQEKPQNMNQIIRWVNNKEHYTDELNDIVTYYFMAQRIKPIGDTKGKAYEDYVKKLTMLHKMLIYSMKAKQTTELSHVEKLKTVLAEFQKAYSAN